MFLNVAFATDMSFLKPTLTALQSLLTHTKSDVVVHFLAHNLTTEGQRDLEAVIAHYPNATLQMHHLQSEAFAGIAQKDARISLVTLGRMFLPSWVEGRVLYLDGDILIEGDVAPLFDIDMEDKPLGVVRDLVVLRRLGDGGKSKPYVYFSNIMAPAPASDYFNAGVLLLDCDAIRADALLRTAMTKMDAMDVYAYLDQDHLNILFKARVLFLDACWNAAWGRFSKHRSLENKLGLTQGALPQDRAVIQHFPGRYKPWNRFRLSVFKRNIALYIRYRKSQARLEALLRG